MAETKKMPVAGELGLSGHITLLGVRVDPLETIPPAQAMLLDLDFGYDPERLAQEKARLRQIYPTAYILTISWTDRSGYPSVHQQECPRRWELASDDWKRHWLEHMVSSLMFATLARLSGVST